jgi:hypothetical protein
MFILMNLYDFRLSAVQFYDVVVYIRKVENRVQIVDRRVP